MDLTNQVFKKYIDLFVIFFIDGILIYSRTDDDHIDNVRLVFEVLKDNQLFTKFSKCDYWLRSVILVGHIVSNEVELNSRKTEQVKSLPRPLSSIDIRIILRLAHYYQRFFE